MKTKSIAITSILFFLAIQWVWQLWQDFRNEHYFPGYIETDARYLASPISGPLSELWVQRGENISANQPLYQIDPSSTQSTLEEIEAKKQLSQIDLQRKQQLFSQHAIPQSELDAAIANNKALEAQLKTLRVTLAQLSPRFNQEAIVQYTYYNPGEWVEANHAIVSLIVPNDIKVRFFVPESQIAKLKVGDTVSLDCDGCLEQQTAIIHYIAPNAEYTPPVIYSRDERHKLLFMCEAKLQSQPLPPIGLPVLVRVAK